VVLAASKEQSALGVKLHAPDLRKARVGQGRRKRRGEEERRRRRRRKRRRRRRRRRKKVFTIAKMKTDMRSTACTAQMTIKMWV